MLRTKGSRHTQHSLKQSNFLEYFFLNLLIRGSLLLILGQLCRGGWLGRSRWLGRGR